jgi:hypothetical protein
LHSSRNLLTAELFRADGSKAGSATVSLFKGELHQFGSDLVLTSDYRGRRPLAIFKGLKEKTIGILMEKLGSPHKSSLQHLSKDDRYAIDRMRKNSIDGGSTYYDYG